MVISTEPVSKRFGLVKIKAGEYFNRPGEIGSAFHGAGRNTMEYFKFFRFHLEG
jgi:hypothetical protein